MKFLRKFWLNINILLVCFTVFAYFAPSINPAKFWPAAFIGLAFPMLIFLNLFFVFYWLMVKPKYSLYSLICLLFGLGSIGNMIAINTSKEVKAHDVIHVMSFNLKNGGEIYSSKKEVRNENTKRFLTKIKPLKNQQIICLQEIGVYAEDLVKKAFPKFHVTQVDNSGTMILTQTPVLNSGKLPFNKTANSCIWADVVIDFDTMRVYSVHLQSNHIREEEVDILDDVTNEYKKNLSEARGVIGKYRHHSKRRSEQVAMLRKHSEQSPYPVIVCGDLNEPPQSYVYDQIAENLCDNFIEKGNGLGSTYAGKIPFLRIDYIFTDQRFDILDHQVIKHKFSDHYPIVSTMRLQPKLEKEQTSE